MKINYINSHNTTSFNSKAKIMRELNDINRNHKAKFDGIASSSYYLMKLQEVYKNPKLKLKKNIVHQIKI